MHRSDSTDGFVPSVCKHKPPPDPAKDQGAVSFFGLGTPHRRNKLQTRIAPTNSKQEPQTRTANQNRDQGLPSPIAPSNRNPAETNRTHKLRTRTTNRPHKPRTRTIAPYHATAYPHSVPQPAGHALRPQTETPHHSPALRTANTTPHPRTHTAAPPLRPPGIPFRVATACTPRYINQETVLLMAPRITPLS